MHVVSIVGARPQFVKLAAVHPYLAGVAGDTHTILHTGQHYDPGMSDVFFAELGLPDPDVNLGIGSSSHGVQTAAMLRGIEHHVDRLRPDWVLTYGDTNSTLAGAVAAVKMHVNTAHLEAGLRSFNRRMPEEHNRVLTDHASDVLLAPTPTAVQNLRMEGLADRTRLVGDVMVDLSLRIANEASPGIDIDVDGPYLLSTIHRAETTDDSGNLAAVLEALRRLPIPVLLPAHPRLVSRASRYGLDLDAGAVRTVAPLSYRAMVAAMQGAVGIITDSGGIQKEAYVLGTLCTTIRSETEWIETLDGGWNVLVDPSADLDDLESAVLRNRPTVARGTPFGDGTAAQRVREALAG